MLLRNFRACIFTVLTALTIFLSASFANADVIISNLPGNDLRTTFINAPSGGSNGGTQWDSKAAGFTMGSTSYQLDNIQLRLRFFSDWMRAVPSVVLFDDAGGLPNTSVAILDNPAFAQGDNTYTFTPNSSVQLEANETYWIVVNNRALVPNSFVWLASSPGIEPTGVASNAGYLFDYNTSIPQTPSDVLNSYAVNGSPIPEPSGLVCLAGLAGAILYRVRRRR